MVRFSWHVEDGLQAYLPPGAYIVQKESSVRHAACEIEIPQSKENLEALLTLPANYLDVDKIKDTGIILGHGNDAEEYKGKLLTELAVFFASHGFVVMRYCCRHKEQRRQRMFEKALDACATSPFARGVNRWVLAGLGSGGRVAAVVGAKCRGSIAGYVMLSYPLKEVIPQPAAKLRRGEDDLPPPPKSSESPLFGIDRPILFVLGDSDELCPPGELKGLAARLSAPDIRVELFEDADQNFKSPTQGKAPASSVMRRLCNSILEFINALKEEGLVSCNLTKAAQLPYAIPGKKGFVTFKCADVFKEYLREMFAVGKSTEDSQSRDDTEGEKAELAPKPAAEAKQEPQAALRPPLSIEEKRDRAHAADYVQHEQKGTNGQRESGSVPEKPSDSFQEASTGQHRQPASGQLPNPATSQLHFPASNQLHQPATNQLPYAASSQLPQPASNQLPQLYQQMLTAQALPNAQQAQQLLSALTAQRQGRHHEVSGLWPHLQQTQSQNPTETHQGVRQGVNSDPRHQQQPYSEGGPQHGSAGFQQGSFQEKRA